MLLTGLGGISLMPRLHEHGRHSRKQEVRDETQIQEKRMSIEAKLKEKNT